MSSFKDWFGGGSVATNGTTPFRVPAETAVVSSEFSYGGGRNDYNGSNSNAYNGNGYNGNGGGVVYGLFGNDNNAGNGGGYGGSTYGDNGGSSGYGGNNGYGNNGGERASDIGGYDQRPGSGSDGYGERGAGDRTGWD